MKLDGRNNSKYDHKFEIGVPTKDTNFKIG